jgi:mevalonate kinase
MHEVSSPGKIHIIGEHAVVYGYPAIISAIDRRTKIRAEKSNKIEIKNHFYQKESIFEVQEVMAVARKAQNFWRERNKKNDFSELFNFLKSSFWRRTQAMIGLILDRLKITPPTLGEGINLCAKDLYSSTPSQRVRYSKKGGGVSLTIDSNLPIGCGLGSSASFSVALSKAIAILYASQLSNQKINEIAFELEKLNHGAPSGGDNSTSTFGGTIWFEKGKMEQLPLPSFLKKLTIVLTPRGNLSTAELVQNVRNLEKSFRDSKIKNIAEATYKMRQSLENGDLEEIKYLINLAQDNLAELGISSPEIDRLVKEVRKIGGAAKISGGGGGTVICFHQDKEKLSRRLKELRFKPLKIKLGVEGVKLEKS